jgi:membrane protease subunit HflC
VISGKREELVDSVRTRMNEDAKQIGAEVIDVRLKRVDFAPEVSERVFDRMQSERKRVANERRATGAAESEKIRADADRQRDVIIAEAYRDAQRQKGEGDARSSQLFAEAFGQNPEFASFYRSLEAYRSSFRSRGDVLVLDPDSDFFRTSAARVRRRARPAPSEAGVPSLVVALGLMLILEGLLPLLSPSGWREAMRRVAMLRDGQIRFMGLAAIGAGLLLVALAR